MLWVLNYNNSFAKFDLFEKEKMQKEYDYVFKFVIVGAVSVGKSSILARFVDDKFQDVYHPTIGIDFRFKYFCFHKDQ